MNRSANWALKRLFSPVEQNGDGLKSRSCSDSFVILDPAGAVPKGYIRIRIIDFLKVLGKSPTSKGDWQRALARVAPTT